MTLSVETSNNPKALEFWNWVKEHETSLVQEVGGDGPMLDELTDRLAEYHDGLVIELGGPDEGRLEFIVSAGGMSEHVPFVRSLVSRAPELEWFDVLAFKPRRDSLFRVSYDGLVLEPDDVRFEWCAGERAIDIVLHLRGYSSAEDARFGMASYIMLDDALGELDVMSCIGSIERRPLKRISGARGLPLAELSRVVDDWKRAHLSVSDGL